MDPCLALHSLARRYCEERFAFWSAQYKALCASGGRNRSDNETEYSDDAFRLFPRYLVLRAILERVEQIVTPSSSEYEMFRASLKASGWNAESIMTVGLTHSRIAVAAMAEERADFEHFLEAVDESMLRCVEPVLYRRVLGPEELLAQWGRLEHLWKVDTQCWWPLREEPARFAWMSFHEAWFGPEKIQAVKDMLRGRRIHNVFELREFRQWGCEREVVVMEIDYTGEEGYWFSEDCDWLIYASHESSITLAGDWLIDLWKRRFPTCDACQYGGPFSKPDLRGSWRPFDSRA